MSAPTRRLNALERGVASSTPPPSVPPLSAMASVVNGLNDRGRFGALLIVDSDEPSMLDDSRKLDVKDC